MPKIDNILLKKELSKNDIIFLLSTNLEDRNKLYARSSEIKNNYLGKTTYFRGLIEFSNVCAKDCLYCGIRSSNKAFDRYTLSDTEIIDAARFAYENKYGSIVLQSGEISNPKFTKRTDYLLKEITKIGNGELGITLSLGEQTEEVYKSWLNNGAHRYLLRIEASNKKLYQKLHPKNKSHSYNIRLEALHNLQKLGYQTGTGVMIGLPFQTIEDLADDLLFMKHFNIDMVGMGPFIEHKGTPLYEYRNTLLPLDERFNLSLKMIAILRIIMPNINIAAATALQAIDKIGREKAIKIGANVIMPNITPGLYRDNYSLYENKPCTDEEAEDCKNCLETRIAIAGDKIAYGVRGDSKHFHKRIGY